ncbi:MAG: thioredoxin family protein [Coriobacteriia bacterium]|nr:thioredoxin family protein [Actinomycetota bacterium]MDZ4167617.1 thioredoxin family protein [Coriobacteriia bacterium]
MVIKILGSGCTNCQKLEGLARKAAEELGIEAEVVKVTDYADIMAFGIMSTPGLVVDESVEVAGRVPSYDEVKTILAGAR